MRKQNFSFQAYFHSFVFLFFCLIFLSTPALAQTERILDFSSTVIINQDGSLLVTENITAWATGDQIKRGIIREFPTDYIQASGQKMRVGFTVLEVLRDGQPEPYHIKALANGQAIYMGDQDVFLDPGQYVYTITYKTTRQLGFFPEYDELYWNVNGNGWRLPIDKVNCIVHLPEKATAINVVSYEGPMGSKGSQSFPGGSSIVKLESSRPYAPLEGLTIAISWPKGFVSEPALGERAFVYGMEIILGIGLVLIFFYYLYAWFRVGRDPAKGVIVPLFNPPQGFSPAMVRMLSVLRFDNTAFTAGIINMAVKGALRIEDKKSGKAVILKDTAPPTLSAGEQAAWESLQMGGQRIDLTPKNHHIWGLAQKTMEYQLDREMGTTYFAHNTGWILPALPISLVSILGGAWFVADWKIFVFICVWLTGWTLACYALTRQFILTWHQPGLGGKIKALLFGLSLTAPFLVGEALGLWVLFMYTTGLGTLLFLGQVLAHALFVHLLKAPTLVGRRVMDEIEGFRMYLGATEKDRLNILHPPNETPELFEKLLPYAIALGVANKWGARFASILAQAGYAPNWYLGSNFNSINPGSFAQSLGSSMTSSIASASTAPGSSSGSSGGGSSGGGGGGGGGGGW